MSLAILGDSFTFTRTALELIRWIIRSVLMAAPPPIVFPEEVFHIHKQVFPLAHRTRIAVGRMRVISRNHGILIALESQVLLSEHHIALPAVAVPDLQKIVKMQVIYIPSV